MKKIRVGIIGCGKIFDKHLKALYSNKNKNFFSLQAVCDNNIKKLNKVKDQSVKKFNNFDNFFKENQNLDLVTICTPSGLHYSHCNLSAKYNLNALVEKPLALDFNGSKKIINNFKKKKLNLFIVKQNRFNKTLIALKTIIDKKLLGKIYLVNFNVFWHRPQKYYDKDKWKGSKKLDGGVIFNQASHHIDIINWLFGRPRTLNCFTSRLGRKIQTEDTAIINLKTNLGTLVSTNVTVLSYKKNYECTINIISEKGNIKIGGTALNKFEHINILYEKKLKELFKKIKYNQNKIYNYGHEEIYEAIYKDICNGTKICPRAEDTIDVIQIIESCHNSAKKGSNILLK